MSRFSSRVLLAVFVGIVMAFSVQVCVAASGSGDDDPILTVIYDHANSYGHLLAVQHDFPDSGVTVRMATFTAENGQVCQWIWSSSTGKVVGYFPTGTMIWTPVSSSTWTVQFMSASGTSWSMPVDVVNGRLYSEADVHALENATSAMVTGSGAVAHAAWGFAIEDGLLEQAQDGSFVVTTERRALRCVVSAVGLAASYGAFVTCAAGALPMCILGIAGHAAAVVGFAGNCA